MRFLTRPNSAAAPTRQRRHQVGRAIRRIGLFFAILAAIAALALPLWLWRSGIVTDWAAQQTGEILKWSAAAGLRVDEVYVTGRKETDAGAILEALAVYRGAPILDLDPDEARARLEALPWVLRASVERQLPSTLRIAIEERQPLAIWQNDGEIALIGTDGAVIDTQPKARFTMLPVVVGPDAAAHATDLIAMLGSEPWLAERVVAAIRVGGRRWNLELDNGVVVNLPELDAPGAWKRLAELERKRKLLDQKLIVIDLRLHPDRLVVRRQDMQIQPLPTKPGKET